MKKYRFFSAFALIIAAAGLFAGCGDKTLDAAVEIVAGDLGSSGLTIDYNKDRREIVVGGEGEVIPFYEEDIAKGFVKAGYRVCLKLTAPREVGDYETGILTVDGKSISSGEFYRSVSGEKTGEVFVSPLIDEGREAKFKVMWQDGTKEQTYKIIVHEGTRFQNDEK